MTIEPFNSEPERDQTGRNQPGRKESGRIQSGRIESGRIENGRIENGSQEGMGSQPEGNALNHASEVFDANFDQQVREAFNAIVIPAGLEQRVLRAVLSQGAEAVQSDGLAHSQLESAGRKSAQLVELSQAEQVKSKSGLPRRAVLALGAAVAVTGIAVAFWPSTMSRQSLTNLCIRNLEAFESQDETNEHRLPSYVLHYLNRSSIRKTQLSVSFDARPFGKSGKAWRLATALGPLYVLEFAKCADMTELNSRITLINEPSECDGWSLLAFRTKSKIVVFATQSNIWELVEKPLLI